jgi:hypothetical protein
MKFGRPIKRRGIFIQRKIHLERFLDVMNQPRLKEFLDTWMPWLEVWEEKVGTLKYNRKTFNGIITIMFWLLLSIILFPFFKEKTVHIS